MRHIWMTGRLTEASVKATLLAAIVIVSLGTEAVDSPAEEAPGRLTPQCDHEAARLLGDKPVPVGGKVREPKRTRHVRPAYPTPPDGTVGSGMTIGAMATTGAPPAAEAQCSANVDSREGTVNDQSADVPARSSWGPAAMLAGAL